MRLSAVLSVYLGRQFLFWFIAVLIAILGLLLLFDMVELIRRTSTHDDATLGIAFEMALLKLPDTGQKAVPFCVLFGAMLAFWRLNRNQELVVARAAGVSVWQFLLPALIVAFLVGAFKVTVFNPLASTLLLRFEQMEQHYIRGRASLLAVSDSGLWLRQASDGGSAVIHALRVSPREMSFSQVTIYLFEGTDKFTARIDAPSARLEAGYWLLFNARISTPEGNVRTVAEQRLETDLTPDTIHDSFAPPQTMSFWSLPSFIADLERAGFSALRHRLYWNAQLAEPILLCAVVLIAATFSLRPTRRGNGLLLVVAAIGTGFLLYFLTDLVFALGLSARIPIQLAAWAPASVAMLLGVSMLLHLEDG